VFVRFSFSSQESPRQSPPAQATVPRAPMWRRRARSRMTFSQAAAARRILSGGIHKNDNKFR
jgi:hypothetical protein